MYCKRMPGNQRTSGNKSSQLREIEVPCIALRLVVCSNHPLSIDYYLYPFPDFLVNVNYLHFQASGRSSTMTSGKSRTEVTMQDPVMLQDASVTSVSLKSCHPREFQRSNRSNCRNNAQIGMTRGQDSQDLYIVKNK